MLSVPSHPGENLAKICENYRASENPRLCLGFSLICPRILPNVRLSFHQARKARRTCFIHFLTAKVMRFSNHIINNR